MHSDQQVVTLIYFFSQTFYFILFFRLKFSCSCKVFTTCISYVSQTYRIFQNFLPFHLPQEKNYMTKQPPPENAEQGAADTSKSEGVTITVEGGSQKNVSDVIQQLLELSEQVGDSQAAQQQLQQVGFCAHISTKMIWLILLVCGLAKSCQTVSTHFLLSR